MRYLLPWGLVLLACYREGYEVTPPSDTLDVTNNHSCLLKNGELWCWGYGVRGLEVNGEDEVDPTPRQVPGLDHLHSLATGDNSDCVLDDDERMRCTNSAGWKTVADHVSGITNYWMHRCAAIGDEVHCGGGNGDGQLGDGGVEDRGDFAAAKGLKGSITDLAVGSTFSCAVVDGAGWCWGDENIAQADDNALQPHKLPNLGEPVTLIDAGMYDACAVVNDVALCWGYDWSGPVGIIGGEGSKPAEVPLRGSGVPTAISVGNDAACAIVDGGVQCWGRSSYGARGEETPEGSAPDWIDGLGAGSDVLEVAVSNNHACARLTGDRVRCWGADDAGQLGPALPAGRFPPTAVELSGVTAIAAGISEEAGNTCAVASGAVYCWGDGAYRLLTVNALPVATPLATSLDAGATAIAVGATHACAVANGDLRCWGFTSYDALGVSTQESYIPIPPLGVTGTATAVVAGDEFSCAVVDGAVWCWGINDDGQMADDVGGYRQPAILTGLEAGVTGLAAGTGHICAVKNGAEVWCWGENVDDACGVSTNWGPVSVPNHVDLSGSITGVAAGQAHSCAIADGELYCWGSNYGRQLLSDEVGASTPTPQLITLDGTIIAVGAGHDATCAVNDLGRVYCFGDGFEGQLGQGDGLLNGGPALIDIPSGATVSVSVGWKHACATVDGTAYCWGLNNYCQLGIGVPCYSSTPVEVTGL